MFDVLLLYVISGVGLIVDFVLDICVDFLFVGISWDGG